MNMSFTLACVRDYLAIHGFVYTIRAEKYDYPAIVRVEGLGEHKAEKALIGKISTEDDLPEHMVCHSGFGDKSEWLAAAKVFGGIPGYVWLVTKI